MATTEKNMPPKHKMGPTDENNFPVLTFML